MKKRVLAAVLALTMAMLMTAMAANHVSPGQTVTVTGYKDFGYGSDLASQQYTFELISVDEALAGMCDKMYMAETRAAVLKASMLEHTPEGYGWIGFNITVPSLLGQAQFEAQLMLDGEIPSTSSYPQVFYLGNPETSDFQVGRLFNITVNGVNYDQCVIVGRSGYPGIKGGCLMRVPTAVSHVDYAIIPFTSSKDRDMSNAYLFHIRGGEQATPASSQTWVSDASGWRVQNVDGSYLTDQWFQYNNQWYYMGADGYMLVNTTTPDGYTVNADGVWVQ